MMKYIPGVLAAVAIGALFSPASSTVQAQTIQDTQKERQIAPGVNPDTGQINPGVSAQPPAGAPPGKNDASGAGANVTNRAPPSDTHAATNQPIPTPEEARAALLAPDSPDAAIGQVALPPTGAAQTAKTATGDAPAENAKAQQAENTKSDPTQSKGGTGPASSESGNQAAQSQTAANQPAQSQPGQSNETTGNAPREQAAKQAAYGTSPNKPIGSTTQTLPAKFSERNEILDRLPTMAWPLRLDDQARRKIFEMVMNDKGDAADIGKLKPADQLPSQLALNVMRPLPQQLGAEPVLNNIQAVKGKDKILLVNPATRIVVDVISN